MKDGTNTEMLWGAVSKLRSRDIRMGEPGNRRLSHVSEVDAGN